MNDSTIPQFPYPLSAALSHPLKRVGAAVGGVVLIVGGAGSIGGAHYVDRYLAPAIAQELSTSLNRPVELGDVKSISPIQLVFGPSSIPPTETDADTVEIEEIAVHFSVQELLNTGEMGLAVTLVRPEIYLDQNDSGDWLETEILLSDDSRFEVTQVRLRNATFVLQPDSEDFVFHRRAIAQLKAESDGADLPAAPELIRLRGVNASAQLDELEEHLIFSLGGRAADGGSLDLSGQVTLDGGQVEATISTNQLAIAQLSAFLTPGLLVTEGKATGYVQMLAVPDQPIDLRGSVGLENFAAWAEGEPNPFHDTSGRLRFEGQEIQVERGSITYGKIPFDVTGTIHLEHGLNLQATVASVSADDFMNTFDLSLPFPVEGALKTDHLTVTGPFDQVVFAGTVTDAAPVSLDQVEFASVQADFALNKGTDVLTLTHTTFTPTTGGDIVGDARVKLGDIDDAVITARARGVSADAIATLYGLSLEDTTLGQLNADTRVVITEENRQAQLRWSLAEGTHPASGLLVATDDGVEMRDTAIQLGGDRLEVTGALADGRWEATLSTAGLTLAHASPDLPGRVQGRVTLAGPSENLSPAAIQAEGAVQVTDLADRVPALKEPLQVAFGWSGDRLLIHNAQTAGLDADGWIEAKFTQASPDITQMHLNLRLEELALTDLPLDLPLAVGGTTRFAGVLMGTPAAPHLDGRIQVNDLALGAIAFDPTLTGRLRVNPDQTLNLALNGDQDQIRLAGTRDRFEVALQRDQAKIHGQVAGPQMQASIQDIPLHWIGQMPELEPAMASVATALGGTLSGQVRFDGSEADNPRLEADMAIAQPALGQLPPAMQRRHRGDRLTASLRYADGVATLTDGQLQFGRSRLQLAGDYGPNGMEGQVQIDHGELRDVLALVQSTSSNPALPATLMALAPSTLSQEWAEDFDIAWLLDEAETVRGNFSGALVARAQPQSGGLQLGLDLMGQGWQIGATQIQDLRLVDGRVEGSHIQVPSLRLTGLAYGGVASPDTTLDITFDTQSQMGTVQLHQVDLAVLTAALGSPVSATGDLGAIARWQWSGERPTLNGTLTLDKPQMGRFGTESLEFGFSYRDEQLQIGQWAIPGNPAQLIATGRIPIRLPLQGLPSEPLPNPIAFVSQSEEAIAPLALGSAVERSAYRPAPIPVSSTATDLVLAYGLVQVSLKMDDLEAFVETGDVPNGWGLYMALADLDPVDLRNALMQEIDLDLVMIDHLLNSSLGEKLLGTIGQVVHSPSETANVQALRSALIFAAQDDGRVSVLEFLHRYPHEKIFINLNRLDDLMDALETPEPAANPSS